MKKILSLFLALCSLSGIAYSDITWSSPTAISTVLTNASTPNVVIDSSGNATAVWVESNTIKASSLPSGGSWTMPTTLSNVLNTASLPKVAVDGSGNVTAIWIENTQITSATLPSGGSWTSSTAVSASGATKPSFSIDSTGNVVAVWIRSTFIESSTRKSGSWSLVSVLSTANSDNPHVVISEFGTAMAVWHSIVSGADVIVSDILTISTNTWATPKNVFNGTASFFHNYPKIAIDANGNATVAWFRYNLLDGTAYQNVQVITSSLSQGANAWGIPTFLSNSGIRNPADLTIKLRYDTSGNTLAVWTNSYDGETFSIESSQRLFGGSWLLFAQPSPPTLYSIGMDVAITSGTAVLTNMAWDGVSTMLIQSQETDTTDPVLQAWSVINPVSTGDDNGFPSCSLSLNGTTFNAVAVWTHFDGSNVVIHAATGTGTVIDPPTSVSASQSVTDFGVYQDYFNTITWSASSDPNVAQYNIFRNGVFCGVTDPSTFQFIDHNAVQGQTVTYGVAALTTSFRQSEIVSFTLVP